MHTPRKCDVQSCMRVAKYLRGTPDAGYRQRVDEQKAQELLVYMDADWAGGKDLRSTSGVRVCWAGSRIQGLSSTQAGLPAMSSGESELRAMAKAVSEGLCAQQVLGEMGEETRAVILSDATAAISNAARLGPGHIRPLGVSVRFVKDAVRTRASRFGECPAPPTTRTSSPTTSVGASVSWNR